MKKANGLHYLYLLLIFSVYLASLWIVNPWGDFPLNDDFVYARGCIQSANANHLVLTGYESAWSLPHILIGSLMIKFFGFSHVLMRCSTILWLFAVMMVIDAYLRRANLPSAERLIVAASFVFNPVSYMISLTFMTDMLFLLFWLSACLAWDIALANGKKSSLIVAVFATMLAMSQRQFALFIPAAVFLLLFVRWRISPRGLTIHMDLDLRAAWVRIWYAGGLVATFGFFVLVSIWWRRIGGYQLPFLPAELTIPMYVILLYKTAIYLVIAVLPLSLTLGWPKMGQRARSFAFGLTGLAVLYGVYRLYRAKFPLFGNMISEFGIFLPNTVVYGTRPVIFNAWTNRVIGVLGIIGFTLIIPRLFALSFPLLKESSSSSKAKPSGVNASAIGYNRFGSVLELSSLIYLVIFMVRGAAIDRYLLPMIPAVWVALSRCGVIRSSASRVLAAACVLAVGAMSITLTHDYFRWNDARWAAAEGLERSGTPVNRISAGYEWDGWRRMRSVPAIIGPDVIDADYLVSFSTDFDGFTVIDSVPWKSIWPPHDRKMFVLKRTALLPPEDQSKGEGVSLFSTGERIPLKNEFLVIEDVAKTSRN